MYKPGGIQYVLSLHSNTPKRREDSHAGLSGIIRELLYIRMQQPNLYLLVILPLIPSDDNPLIPLLPLIQHHTKLPCQSQFIAGAQNALNVARSDFFIHSRNAGNPTHARNTRHHDKAQHGERADSDKLAECT